MEQIKLDALVRDKLGKGHSRRLRMQGMIPSVLYGPRTETVHLAIDSKELKKVLSSSAGTNVLINLLIQRGDRKEGKTVMLKDYQLDSIKRTLIHADLYEISMDEKIRVTVPIRLVGRSPGVEKGGTLGQVLREVEIECLPGDIPDSIDVNISELEIGDSIHVEDIAALKGIDIFTDKKTAIVTIVGPMAEEEKVEEEVEAPEVAPPEMEE